MTPRILDLFCGAGGAAMGYSRAGFEVVGVDLVDQPNYPFEFIRDDALGCFDPQEIHRTFDAIHSSPPCQAHSALRFLSDNQHPDLIGPTREMLRLTGLPYVIENVMGAPLYDATKVCGSAFGLGVRRHRLFETNFPVMAVPCSHSLQPEPIDVTGTGGPTTRPRSKPGGGISRKPASLQHARDAMGIDWMARDELSEAIPPAYCEHIGSYLIAHLEAQSKAAARPSKEMNQ